MFKQDTGVVPVTACFDIVLAQDALQQIKWHSGRQILLLDFFI